MLAPFATLAFLAALWLVAKLMVDVLAADGGKIAAALSGRSFAANPRPALQPISVRFQPRAESVRRPMRVTPAWRAAA